MRYCTACHNSYPDTVQVCPGDGTPLLNTDIISKMETMENMRPTIMNDPEDEHPTPKLGETSKNDFIPNDIIGSTIEGKYEIQSLLGMGGMGSVYKARHIFINNEVAVKIINPKLATSNDITERFLREAQAAAMIDHPNAIKVTDFGRAGEMLYLVMEFVQGQSLRNIIHKEGFLTPLKTVEIMVQVCAALDAAHSHNIIHRDLKPDNIMIKQNDLGQLTVKVLDFGLAKIKTPDSNSITGAGIILGTLSYMSPEQCTGENVIDLRTDIYSLGVVVFEMLTGKLPFNATNYAGFLTKHIFEEPPKLRSIKPDIPEGIERAVLHAMEKEPSARHKSAGDFAVELTRAVKSAQGTDAKQSPEVEKDRATARYIGGNGGVTQSASNQKASNSKVDTMAYQSQANPAEQKIGTIDTLQTGMSPDRKGEQSQKTGVDVVPPPDRRRIQLFVGILVALIVLFGGGYYAFKKFTYKGPAAAGSQRIDAAAPGMVLIEGGWLKMGSAEGYDYEQPVHEVYVNSFYIDETEVTNEQFEQFVKATKYITDSEKSGNDINSWRIYATPERKNHPVVLVSWNDATAYAKWAGKRLPTEAEWEYAARGGLIGKKYPWGDDAPPRLANFGRGRKPDTPPTEPVKTYETNGYGLYDMAGNVSEWCQDWYDPDYYHNSPERNPAGPSTGQSRVIRGGSWYTDFNQIRVAGRISESAEGYEYDRGFRCAKNK
jgi:eukaryotic-like serine/threonine-protein kinase